jgi:cytoskeleton protein RodZ
MGAFGERLRREREMRGITLAEISESTKIASRHLESLEKQDFDSLPGGIFNKGFVRAYARFLGIDEDQAVADYCQASAEPSPPENQFPLEVHARPDRKLNPRRSAFPLVLALLALVGVLVFLWARNKNHQIESADNIVPPAATGTASPVDSSLAAANTSPSQPQVQPSETDTSSPEHTFLVVVVIQAKEKTWVSLTADGKKIWKGTLQAGQQRVVRAEKQIVLATGNAGGLDVSYNGRALGAIGNESEVRTLTFTPAGLVQ